MKKKPNIPHINNDQKQAPLFTIIIPAYNHENYVQKAILSVLNQTYSNMQLIVINDGSKDNTDNKIRELINQYPGRFEYINKKNEGVSTTLNLGLSLAKGTLFYYLASDDLLFPDTIATVVDLFQKSTKKTGLIYSDYFEQQEEITTADCSNGILTDKKNIFKAVLKNTLPILGPCCFFKTECLKSVGGFHNSLPLEDFYIVLKITFHFDVSCYNKKIVFHRLHETNSAMQYKKIGPAAIKTLTIFFNEYHIKNKKLKKEALEARHRWQAWVGFNNKDRRYALHHYTRSFFLRPFYFFLDINYIKSWVRTLLNQFK